ncbi:MAG: magnesium transporter, partial [Pseudomonadales bacterium]|nr:magnesium transporter [Pseudomonadales bacterium]
MTDANEPTPMQPLDRLAELLETGAYSQIRNMIDSLKAEDLADLLESSPPRERTVIWSLASEAQQSEILRSVDDDIVNDLLSDQTEQEIVQLLENVGADDDLADILQHLPETISTLLLQSMDAQDRARLE